MAFFAKFGQMVGINSMYVKLKKRILVPFYFNLEYLYHIFLSKKAFFEENGWSIVNLLNDVIVFKLSLMYIKSFCSCSLNEI